MPLTIMISEEKIFLNVLMNKRFRIVDRYQNNVVNGLEWISLEEALAVRNYPKANIQGYTKGAWRYICMLDKLGPAQSMDIIKHRVNRL